MMSRRVIHSARAPEQLPYSGADCSQVIEAATNRFNSLYATIQSLLFELRAKENIDPLKVNACYVYKGFILARSSTDLNAAASHKGCDCAIHQNK